MCGRFTQRLSWRELVDLYRLLAPAPTINPPVRWNGAPTQDFAACLLDDGGQRTIRALRWGLLPPWASDMRIGARLINARAETVHEKPAFRHAFKRRRCLIPAHGWFEWKRAGKERRPFLIEAADEAPGSGGARLLRPSRSSPPRRIPTLAELHARQPAVIAPSDFGAWLDPRRNCGRTAGDGPDAASRPVQGGRGGQLGEPTSRNDGPEVVMQAGG